MVQQVIRPTGLVDPEIEVRPIKGQMDDLLSEIKIRAAANERVLVTILTKKMAENLTDFLKDIGIRVRYLHSDIPTIERTEIIRDLRAGVFDVLIGINLLREGLDLPEVTLVAILDADKEGFLRSDTSLIQTIGRAARNVNGIVIMYADVITKSMMRAIDETDRRRDIQNAYNIEHDITPTTIIKRIKDLISTTKVAESSEIYRADNMSQLSQDEMLDMICNLEKDMRAASKQLQFERAGELRDMIVEIKGRVGTAKSAAKNKKPGRKKWVKK